MAMASMMEWGSPSSIERSMKAPGSPSSALQTTYFWSACTSRVIFHLSPVETAAAAAAQSGVHNLADDLLRSHLKYLAQGGVTVAGDVFVDVLRVDEAAVAQGDADLGFIELHVLGVGDVSARVGGDIEQALHLASLDDVFADDGLGVFRFDRYVEGIVGHRLDDGACSQKPKQPVRITCTWSDSPASSSSFRRAVMMCSLCDARQPVPPHTSM